MAQLAVGTLLWAIVLLGWHPARAQPAPPPLVVAVVHHAHMDFATGGTRKLQAHWNACSERASLGHNPALAERCLIYACAALLLTDPAASRRGMPIAAAQASDAATPGLFRMLDIMGVPERLRTPYLSLYQRWALERQPAESDDSGPGGIRNVVAEDVARPIGGFPESDSYPGRDRRDPAAGRRYPNEGQQYPPMDPRYTGSGQGAGQRYPTVDPRYSNGFPRYPGAATRWPAAGYPTADLRYPNSILDPRYSNPGPPASGLSYPGNDRSEVTSDPGSAGPRAQPAGEVSEIPLQLHAGDLVVPVVLNNTLTLKFAIDSGSSDVSVSSEVVSMLMRSGTLSRADFRGSQTYSLADGSKVANETFVIHVLKVGDREVRNVVASVATESGGLLLGQSFLNRFKSWSIDNQRQVLVLK